MEKQKRSVQEKLMIVLEGMREHSRSITLAETGLLKHESKAFDYGGPDKENERLRKENQDLKSFVCKLTVELKKRKASHGKTKSFKVCGSQQ